MAENPTKPLQTLYRMVVMGGTLAVGSMAAYRYGPPPERLAGMINDTAGWVAQMQEKHFPSSVPAAPNTTAPMGESGAFGAADEPAPFAADTLAPLAPAVSEPMVDSAVAPASAIGPLAERSLDPLDQEQVLAPLYAAGARDAQVRPWGSSGSLYRASASIPVGETGLARHREAVAESPERAVEALVAQMEN